MQLALGTVQFGLPYGITNQDKTRVQKSEAEKILSFAHQNNIHFLDTASAYGESEKRLGELMKKMPQHQFHIITKTQSLLKNKITKHDADSLESTLQHSLQKLQQTMLYGLMIHEAGDLMAKNSEFLFEKLLYLKQKKYITKIGCSFYHPEDLFRIIEKFDLDVVQIPINLFDQRFIHSGALAFLYQKNIEVHVRSIFLQGLLLSSINNLLAIKMECATPYLKKLDVFCQCKNMSRLSVIIAFLKTLSHCRFVVGFQCVTELQELLKNINLHNITVKIDFTALQVLDNNVINPTRWPKK